MPAKREEIVISPDAVHLQDAPPDRIDRLLSRCLRQAVMLRFLRRPLQGRRLDPGRGKARLSVFPFGVNGSAVIGMTSVGTM